LNNRFQVIWTPTAKTDLIEIIKYISTEIRTTAKRIAKKIQEKAHKILREVELSQN